MDNLEKLLEDLKSARETIGREMGTVIVGQDDVIEKLLVGLYAGGHCLLVGVPGLAKTLMIRTLARILDLSFKRIQFTPDLMPADITGIDILQEEGAGHERILRFTPGPVFANLVLADEINRAPPKTQAALLEAMQEYQVTVSGTTYPLPRPFLVLATQNPIELEGTYPLPEAQLDRFMLSISMDYPDEESERLIAEKPIFQATPDVTRVLDAERIIRLQDLVRKIPVSDYVVRYAVSLVRATRPDGKDNPEFVRKYVSWGAGPRATQHLVLAAKTRAALRGDVNVSAADVRAVAEDVLNHRIFTNFTADADGVDSRTIVRKLLTDIPEGA